MELIDQAEKSLYEKCKYEVKVWEYKFKKANGRLPSRLDIKEADSSVRNAYKTYFRLKTAALERSFMGIDGFHSDEDQMNCDTQQENNASKAEESYDKSTKTLSTNTWGKHLNKKPLEKSHSEPLKSSANLNQKFVSKLSAGSKLVKRNPRKSLSQNKQSSSYTAEKQVVNLNDDPVSICRSNSEPIKCETNSDDFVSLIDTTQLNTQNIKIVSSNKIVPKSINIINDLMDRKDGLDQKLRNVDVRWLERVEIDTNINNQMNAEVTKIDTCSDEDIIEESDDDSNYSSHAAKRFKCSNSSTPNITISVKQINKSDTPYTQTPVVNSSFGFQTPSTSNISQKPSTFNISQTSATSISTTPSARNGIPAEVEMNTPTQKIQFNKNNSNNLESVKSSSFDQKQKIDEMDMIPDFKKKNLNENFVRINMKKKVYARGKKTMNFSKYKKQLWKSRKKFIEDQEGGNESSKTKFSKLMPLNEYDSDDGSNALETLNEASGEVVAQNLPFSTNQKKPADEQEEDDNLPLAVIKQHLLKSSPEVTNIKLGKTDTSRIRKKASDNKFLEKNSSKPKVTRAKTKIMKKKIDDKLNETHADDMEIETESRVMEHSSQHNFNDEDDFNLLLETIRIENTIDMRCLYPLYSTKDDGSLIDTPNEVFDALRLFGHESFREGQEKAVMRILSGKSTLVTSSTGSGKSLCYQLPAYLFRQKYRCISLVISPLISLMEDQIKCMPGVLNAVCLHGNQTKSQRDTIIKSLTDGDVSILMVSPEAILSSDYSFGFGYILSRIPPIAFACLDEAHCLSQWSHNFRPSYLVVCQILQEKLGIKTILGLTATATQCTRDSLIEQIQIPDGDNGIIRDTPIPTNLKLTVSRDTNREHALLELLLSKPFEDFTSIIIYCLRRNECEKVASFLRASLKDYIPPTNTKKRKRISSQVEAYHAGLSGAKRKTIQNAFTSGDLRIVVATVAFGMGINKSDIRSVIHYNMPASFESYVQEIGRAGRDRLPAHCHIFLDRQHADVYELRRHIYSNSVDRHIIRKLLRKVFVPCKCEGTCMKHEIIFSVQNTVSMLDIPEEVISTLLCYLELHDRKYIKVLKQTYGKCKVVSYGGSAILHKTALTCEPLKLAISNNENEDDNVKSVEFSIGKVSKLLNHDTGMCKQILKNLEWTNVNGQPKRTALNVEFSDLSFHLLAPGNLPDEDLDEVLDTLYRKVVNQENIAYAQLIDIDQTLSSVAVPTCKSLAAAEEKSEILKKDIRQYFESKKAIQPVEIPEITEDEKGSLIRDIKLLVDRYGDESFTGRSIARIFHGIASPNFQPKVWGRTKFWRSHLKVHFNTICKIATAELIRHHS